MSELDTFNKLRRSSYNEACAIYTMTMFGSYPNISEEEKRNLLENELKYAGWTLASFFEESAKQHKIELESLGIHLLNPPEHNQG